MNGKRAAIAAVSTEIAFAACFVWFGPAVHGVAYADDSSGIVSEDSADWSCATMGNRICGPNNAEHVAAGCYSDTGSMVAVWPCFVVVSADGSSDVYTVDDAR